MEQLCIICRCVVADVLIHKPCVGCPVSGTGRVSGVTHGSRMRRLDTQCGEATWPSNTEPAWRQGSATWPSYTEPAWRHGSLGYTPQSATLHTHTQFNGHAPCVEGFCIPHEISHVDLSDSDLELICNPSLHVAVAGIWRGPLNILYQISGQTIHNQYWQHNWR